MTPRLPLDGPHRKRPSDEDIDVLGALFLAALVAMAAVVAVVAWAT